MKTGLRQRQTGILLDKSFRLQRRPSYPLITQAQTVGLADATTRLVSNEPLCHPRSRFAAR